MPPGATAELNLPHDIRHGSGGGQKMRKRHLKGRRRKQSPVESGSRLVYPGSIIQGLITELHSEKQKCNVAEINLRSTIPRNVRHDPHHWIVSLSDITIVSRLRNRKL